MVFAFDLRDLLYININHALMCIAYRDIKEELVNVFDFLECKLLFNRVLQTLSPPSVKSSLMMFVTCLCKILS